ncbi:hypothetical protein BJY52DRAFT_1221263 [Lactarius psammicola]|nr:hypothetical protein BJY52DRAFT_1221263 [Lactarius psammicola]
MFCGAQTVLPESGLYSMSSDDCSVILHLVPVIARRLAHSTTIARPVDVTGLMSGNTTPSNFPPASGNAAQNITSPKSTLTDVPNSKPRLPTFGFGGKNCFAIARPDVTFLEATALAKYLPYQQSARGCSHRALTCRMFALSRLTNVLAPVEIPGLVTMHVPLAYESLDPYGGIKIVGSPDASAVSKSPFRRWEDLSCTHHREFCVTLEITGSASIRVRVTMPRHLLARTVVLLPRYHTHPASCACAALAESVLSNQVWCGRFVHIRKAEGTNATLYRLGVPNRRVVFLKPAQHHGSLPTHYTIIVQAGAAFPTTMIGLVITSLATKQQAPLHPQYSD